MTNRGISFPAIVWELTYEQAGRFADLGGLTTAQWAAYQAVWRYSAPRFSDWAYSLGPRVSDAHATLDAFEAALASIEQEPALPGAEHVRAQEVTLPRFDLPAQSFTLTAPEESQPAQVSLFGGRS